MSFWGAAVFWLLLCLSAMGLISWWGRKARRDTAKLFAGLEAQRLAAWKKRDEEWDERRQEIGPVADPGHWKEHPKRMLEIKGEKK